MPQARSDSDNGQPPPHAPAASPGQALRRRERLRGQKRLDELFKDGRFGQARLATVRSLPNGLPYARAAVLVGKAAGGAVDRNRLRRRLRAAFRLQKAETPAGRDYALLPRRGALEASWTDLLASVASALARAADDSPASAPPPPRERRRKR